LFKTAKFQICQRRYQPNLTFDFGGYDYWHLRILANTALVVLKFGVGAAPVQVKKEQWFLEAICVPRKTRQDCLN